MELLDAVAAAGTHGLPKGCQTAANPKGVYKWIKDIIETHDSDYIEYLEEKKRNKKRR